MIVSSKQLLEMIDQWEEEFFNDALDWELEKNGIEIGKTGFDAIGGE